MKRSTMIVLAWQAALLVVFLGVWEGAVALKLLNPFWASSPSRIAAALAEVVREPQFFGHVAATFSETIAGFLIGAGLGVIIGFVIAEWPMVERVTSPFFAALNSLPRVALAPLFILWLGVGMWSKIVIAATLVVFIVIGNTLAAARSVDADMVTVARLLGAKRGQLFFKVVLPAAAPVVFAGLRLGVIYAMLGTVVGEMMAANRGLGYMLSFYAGGFQVSHLMATLLVLVALSTALSGGTSWLERWLSGGNRKPRAVTETPGTRAAAAE